MTTENKIRALYTTADYIATLVATVMMCAARWWYVPIVRKLVTLPQYFAYGTIISEIVLFPVVMMLIYWLSGYYRETIVKSRIQEFSRTFLSTLTGSLVFFFIAIIDDMEPDRLYIYKLFLLQWGILFAVVYTVRCTITIVMRRRVRRGLYRRNTVVVGSGDRAVQMCRLIERSGAVMGLKLCGVATRYPSELPPVDVPVIDIDTTCRMIIDRQVQTVVVTQSSRGTQDTLDVINRLVPTDCTVLVDPDFYKGIGATVRTSDVAGEPLVNISAPGIQPSTANFKRLTDVVLSAMGLVVLSPLMLAIYIVVKLDSPGGAIYTQQRSGRHRRPFTIYKFRSMHADAEIHGPQLSTPGDPRVTRVGATLRKYRLDELPQLWNVLRGDMSLVGPRPEREHFIAAIMERAPAYALVQQVRPGLTSWGMVKYGYASDVDGMIKRLRYELLYLDNMSTLLDWRIMLFTLKTVITGRGV